MTDAKPTSTNRRTNYEPDDVDWTGSVGPYSYRAWRVDKGQIPAFVRAVILKDEAKGDPQEGGAILRAQRHVGPASSSVYHEKPTIEALRHYLLRKVRRERVPSDNDVPEHPRWEKRITEKRAQRETWREPDVETFQTSMGTHHRIKRQWEVELDKP